MKADRIWKLKMGIVWHILMDQSSIQSRAINKKKRLIMVRDLLTKASKTKAYNPKLKVIQ